MRSPLSILLFTIATMFAIWMAMAFGMSHATRSVRSRDDRIAAAIRFRDSQMAELRRQYGNDNVKIAAVLNERMAKLDSLREDLHGAEGSMDRARADWHHMARVRGKASRLTMDGVALVRQGEDDPNAVKMDDVLHWENDVAEFFAVDANNPALAARWAACPPASQVMPGTSDEAMALPGVRIEVKMQWFRRLLTEVY